MVTNVLVITHVGNGMLIRYRMGRIFVNYKSGHVSCELWFSAIIVGCARVSAPTQGRVASGRFDFMLIEEPCLAGIIHIPRLGIAGRVKDTLNEPLSTPRTISLLRLYTDSS